MIKRSMLAAAVAGLFTGTVLADVKLPAIFGDHMVLQQDQKLTIWGWADPGEKISVTVLEQGRAATADDQGNWRVVLEPVQSARPIEVTVSGKNTVKLTDVLVGEVWLCSGQSNMEFELPRVNNADREQAAATDSQIRLFTVAKSVQETPAKDVKGKWEVCTPDAVNDFSAVGYFFGRELRQKLNRPVGLIHASWGGTPAEAWTEASVLNADPMLRPIVEQYEKRRATVPARKAEFKKRLAEWMAFAKGAEANNGGEKKNWQATDFDDASWKTMREPNKWEQAAQLNIDGFVWLRKSVTVPADWDGKALKLSLGRIDDYDMTYFNGKRVGSTLVERGNGAAVERRYDVPANAVKQGKAVIAVRIFDTRGDGGFGGPGGQMTLARADGAGAAVGLTGDWKYEVERVLKADEYPVRLSDQPAGATDQNSPAALYNGMINGIAGVPIRGALWYQGEANAGRAFQYRTLLPAMIKNWRGAWQQGDFPFLIVQLAGWHAPQTEPVEATDWPELREAQFLTTKALPNVGIATAIDVGDANDIHPRDKQTVGHRLAMVALQDTYGQTIEGHSPSFHELKVEDGKAVLAFDHVGDGLKMKGDALKGFAVCGADKKWVWADARLTNNDIVLSSPKVPQPIAARYGWGYFPASTVYNSSDLPLLPFRTDDFPMVTKERRVP